MTAAMPPQHGTGWLVVPALAALFALLRSGRSPARLAWIFGLVHQATLLHWLFLLGPDATISSRGLIPVSAVAAILYTSLFYLLFGWATGLARRLLGPDRILLLMPPLWTGMEALRTAGELGFPWCLSGAAFLQTPLYPLAAAGGELALGAGAAFAGAAIAALLGVRGDARLRPAALALALAAVAGWAALALGSRGAGTDLAPYTTRVAAVQADVSLHDKWREATIDSTTIPYTRLTAEAADSGAVLVVWAETAVPAYLMYDKPLLEWVRAVADTNHVFIYTGFPDAVLDARNRQVRYNGSGLFGPNGMLRDRYAKHHLLPFGERMPFQKLLPWLGRLDLGQAEWAAGRPPHPMTVDPDLDHVFSIAGLICYESIFPSLARGAARLGTSLLVNITNDGWFGRTAGPVQHAEMARMRAAETGLPLLRCANNGISYVADSHGRVIAWAGLGERTVVLADIRPGRGDTAFVRYGSWPLTIILLLWTAGTLVAALRRRPV